VWRLLHGRLAIAGTSLESMQSDTPASNEGSYMEIRFQTDSGAESRKKTKLPPANNERLPKSLSPGPSNYPNTNSGPTTWTQRAETKKHINFLGCTGARWIAGYRGGSNASCLYHPQRLRRKNRPDFTNSRPALQDHVPTADYSPAQAT